MIVCSRPSGHAIQYIGGVRVWLSVSLRFKTWRPVALMSANVLLEELAGLGVE
jgi:hypothetical protein